MSQTLGDVSSLLAAPPAPRPASARPALRTWHVFAALVLLSAALAWYSREYVFTREVYHAVFRERLDASRIDDYFNTIQSYSVWSYMVLPPVLLLRLAVVAFLAQLYALLTLSEVPLRRCFTAAAWAYPALLYAAVLRALYIRHVGAADLTASDLRYVPSSLSALLLDPAGYRTPLYALLNTISIPELLWCVAFFFGLRVAARLKPAHAALVAGAVWATTAVFQWGTSVLSLSMN